MLIEERRQHILGLVQSHGRVLVNELSENLGISQITIRKDLDYLQSKGLVQRTHGGALPLSAGAMFDPSLQEKMRQHSHEKQRIANAAAKLVQEGQCVMLDSGTTTTVVAQALRRFGHLTVITNAINIAADLAGTDFDVILTGGTLRKNSFSLVGPLAEDVLEEMHADILFLGVDGFDLEIGLTTPNVLESRVNRAMVKAAKRVVVVCDSTKFHRRSLSRIVPPASVHCIVTDKALAETDVEVLRGHDIEVILV
ncbi:transcriptional repressor AgaR [Acidobacterium sp. S8]|uniref:transcriptional repressor AgaR n=1 Tax=Acidobacterium sp. S8 TaxID=1641854 RepID=UPI00131BE50C|nr:transcriptional repressor AgaR [Acidobacterium sp. S8]